MKSLDEAADITAKSRLPANQAREICGSRRRPSQPRALALKPSGLAVGARVVEVLGPASATSKLPVENQPPSGNEQKLESSEMKYLAFVATAEVQHRTPPLPRSRAQAMVYSNDRRSQEGRSNPRRRARRPARRPIIAVTVQPGATRPGRRRRSGQGAASRRSSLRRTSISRSCRATTGATSPMISPPGATAAAAGQQSARCDRCRRCLHQQHGDQRPRPATFRDRAADRAPCPCGADGRPDMSTRAPNDRPGSERTIGRPGPGPAPAARPEESVRGH